MCDGERVLKKDANIKSYLQLWGLLCNMSQKLRDDARGKEENKKKIFSKYIRV